MRRLFGGGALPSKYGMRFFSFLIALLFLNNRSIYGALFVLPERKGQPLLSVETLTVYAQP